MCWLDRLALSHEGWHSQKTRTSWFRCRCSHHRADLHVAGPGGLCIYPKRRLIGAKFCQETGCHVVGRLGRKNREELDAAIIFAPIGDLVPKALRAVRKGGRVVCGIHISEIPAMPYANIWGERELVSVANLTRQDARDFFPIAAKAGVLTTTVRYSLKDANTALEDLRSGRLNGAAVVVPSRSE